MDSLYYTSLSLLTLGWLHRYKKVKDISKPEYFLAPDNEPASETSPLASILIPARNEEKNIRRCLESILAQDYANLEVIIIDDRSTDKTASIVREISSKDKRVVLIENDHCPDGWSGKNHALTRGVSVAKGEYLIFTDADTFHYSNCIKTAVKYAKTNNIDLLSVNPHLVTKTFWENVIMPVAGAVLMIWYPVEKINDDSTKYSYANGQFILAKKTSYDKIGGHMGVKAELLEDLALAKKIKESGLKLRVLWGPELYQTHMYTSLKDIWRGWVRIFFYGFNKRLSVIISSLVLMLIFSFLPYGLALYALIKGSLISIALSIALLTFILYIVADAYKVAKSNKWYSSIHLLGGFIVSLILINVAFKIIFKSKITWRGISYSS